jgi:acyl-CoA thioesterase YciA
VSCYCSLGEVGGSSVAVRIETWARQRGGMPAEKVTEGVFTYVAIDDAGHPRDIAARDGE